MDSLDRKFNSESATSTALPSSSPALTQCLASTSVSNTGHSADPDISGGHVERTVSLMLPPATKPLSRRLSSFTPQICIAEGLESEQPPPSASLEVIENTARSSGASADIQEADAIATRQLPATENLPSTRSKSHVSLQSAKAMDSLHAENDPKRVSVSSLYSIGSAIYLNARGISGSYAGSVAESDSDVRTDGSANGSTLAASSLSVTTASHTGGLGATSPRPLSSDQLGSSLPSIPTSALQATNIHVSQSAQSLQWSAAARPQHVSQGPATRSASGTRALRTISGSIATASASPGSERSIRDVKDEKKKNPSLGIIGVCALDNKARSKPSRKILSKMIANEEFDVIIFGDKVILDEDVENWPVCDYLISFFSDGFPLDKAIAYSKLRKPFCVNDLSMQTVLWDRRLCLMILDKLNVPTPHRIEIDRDGGPTLPSPEMAQLLHEQTGIQLPGAEDGTGGGKSPPRSIELSEDGETLTVDGVTLRKPFVEKPVSGEDHNIRVYYSKSMGGGGRKLFRKVNNKSSERDDSLMIPRAITEPETSYIYEEFLMVENAEDIKAYTVGPDFCHAETRKSPVVDGVVKRNPNGKELRYITSLTKEEVEIASKVVQAFGQRVCGFDLLRANGKSYVIDVNGWSFVKDNNEYYDNAARILRELFIREKARRDGTLVSQETDKTPNDENASDVPQRKSTPSHRIALGKLFHSPSLPKLKGHGHQHHAHGDTASIDRPNWTLPISSPPSMENSARAVPIPIPGSQPHFPLASTGDVDTSDSHTTLDPLGITDEKSPLPLPASSAQWKLKGMVSVIRHADRTPKQKFKFTFHTKPFVDLLKGHQEEVLLIGEPALNSVLDAVQKAYEEKVEDVDKLKLLRSSLIKKGGQAGTKVQIKPMFRQRKSETLPLKEPLATDSLTSEGGAVLETRDQREDSTSDVTLSRIAAKEKDLVLDKLQLIVKWGGEPTHSARYQAQDLGENLRSDLMILNRECVTDVTVYSSSERRVTTSAQIFATAFTNQKDLPSDFITIRKQLLDDSNAAKDEMDKVKKKIKQLLREGDKAPAQFAWPDETPEPFVVVRRVVELMNFHRKVMRHNFTKLSSGAAWSLAAVINPVSVEGSPVGSSDAAGAPAHANLVSSIQPRWCSGEDTELFRERWDKLFEEFVEAEKVDPSKISELYDTMKFDALHNRQFLEWVFTPDTSILEGNSVSSSGRTSPIIEGKTQSSTADSSRQTSRSELRDVDKVPERERSHLAQRMGFRRRSDAVERAPSTASFKEAEKSQESYFHLYKGTGSGTSKVKLDARLEKLRELYKLCKVLFDYIGPQEYGISSHEKLEIGLLTSLPLLKEIVKDVEEVQASEGAKSFFYFTKESHIYTLLNCILEGGVKTKIERKAIPELDYLSQINFELYESQNVTKEGEDDSFNYSIRISISPGCHTFDPLDVLLDSKHCIGCAPRRSLTAHGDWKQILETLREKFTAVDLPKTFTAVNLSEKGVFPDEAGCVPSAIGDDEIMNDITDDNGIDEINMEV